MMMCRRFNPGSITRRCIGKPNNNSNKTLAGTAIGQRKNGGSRGGRRCDYSGPSYRDELDRIVHQSGVRLTRDEVGVLRKRLDANGDGKVSMDELLSVGRNNMEKAWTRELCLSVAETPTSQWGSYKTRVIQFLDFGGKALFSVVGTQVAGDVGMNIVGCTFVGCVSCLGGGTLNNLLYGTPAILGKPGVNWVNNPKVFYIAMAASVFTFFAWPYYCHAQAKEELTAVFGPENLERDGSVNRATFYNACNRNPEFKTAVEVALKLNEDEDLAVMFDALDIDRSGYIELDEMQSMIGLRFNASPTLYALDTVALSALAVVGVHNAIGRGLAPVVAASSGVTICFGGILRDVLCGRDVVLGAQSYALATGAGSTVYILLRELSLRGIPVHMAVRILLSISTTITIRAWEYFRKEQLLKPMHYDRLQAKREMALHRASANIVVQESGEEKPNKPRTTIASVEKSMVTPVQ
jgi:uncharacterized membrane protein YeiH